jgi:hypothetical protein
MQIQRHAQRVCYRPGDTGLVEEIAPNEEDPLRRECGPLGREKWDW